MTDCYNIPVPECNDILEKKSSFSPFHITDKTVPQAKAIIQMFHTTNISNINIYFSADDQWMIS